MKIELNVSIESDESAFVMAVKREDEILGHVRLPHTGNSAATAEWNALTARENRDAIAGVFLASITAAARKREKVR